MVKTTEATKVNLPKEIYKIYKFQKNAIICYIIEELEKVVKYADFIKRRLVLKGLPVDFATRWKKDGDILRLIIEINLSELMREVKNELLSELRIEDTVEENEEIRNINSEEGIQ